MQWGAAGRDKKPPPFNASALFPHRSICARRGCRAGSGGRNCKPRDFEVKRGGGDAARTNREIKMNTVKKFLAAGLVLVPLGLMLGAFMFAIMWMAALVDSL